MLTSTNADCVLLKNAYFNDGINNYVYNNTIFTNKRVGVLEEGYWSSSMLWSRDD
eukprot:m.13309 g.13309  ORF g.13309 m.13309 type:complete len:55 (+) comp9681_c0_seq2:146-310(+)